jgi:hypothetical protein
MVFSAAVSLSGGQIDKIGAQGLASSSREAIQVMDTCAVLQNRSRVWELVDGGWMKSLGSSGLVATLRCIRGWTYLHIAEA